MLKEHIWINDTSLMGGRKLGLIRILKALNYLLQTTVEMNFVISSDGVKLYSRPVFQKAMTVKKSHHTFVFWKWLTVVKEKLHWMELTSQGGV